MTSATRLMDINLPQRAVQRLRHPLKARHIVVQRVQRITPNFVRVQFAGEELGDFISASFDDHLKLLLPDAQGRPPALPRFDSEAPPDAPRPLMRDYTPRWFDTERGLLDIEFALHGHGPAAHWAAQARPGQIVGVAGPRGSFVVPLNFDWHLLIGDESALPAIARRLEELPPGVPAVVLIETADPADRRELSTRAQAIVQWLQCGSGALLDAVRRLLLPSGEGYAWAAGEAANTAAVRRVLVDVHSLDKDHIRAAAYWKQGAISHHENL